MAITQAVANSFKKELLEGEHKFQYTSGDVFKLAYSGQYTQGGGALVKPNPSTSVASGVAIVTFSDLSFTGVTLTARGALIYNTSSSNKAVAVLNFGADKTATSGTFTIQFPAFTTSAAILRIGNA
jgi:hypothetical protein